jgi:endo-1,4-beta-D-glucanase Y
VDNDDVALVVDERANFDNILNYTSRSKRKIKAKLLPLG